MTSCTIVDMDIQVDIPLPPASRSMYPFAEMEVGHSFVEADPMRIRNVRSAVYMYSQRHPGIRFTVRWQRAEQAWRVWRVS